MIKNIITQIGLSRYQGVTNVIQNVKPKDILLMACSTKEQLDSLLEKNLPKDFEGLLLAPFQPKIKLDSILVERKYFKEIESELVDHFYPLQKDTVFVGVTGTNGKTSVAWLFSELGRLNGKNILYMGTPGVFLGGKTLDEKILTTTPSYLDLRKLSFQYKGRFHAISLEVSSHALAQARLDDIKFKAGAWTNFTQDHLDFHKTMDEYFEAKKKLLELVEERVLIVPSTQKELINKLGNSTQVASSLESYTSKIPSVYQSGFTRENLEVALALYEKAFQENLKGINLEEVTLPPGRFQVVQHAGRIFIVDYAHTPDALESLLEHVSKIYSNKKIVTVFGCGGDRDKTKRPLMGAAAEKGSHQCIVTSDNPRTEDPLSIIKDVLKGMSEGALFEIDRKKAVQKAKDVSSKDSVIVVAGKGHEDYQEIDGVRHKLSDFEIIAGVS